MGKKKTVKRLTAKQLKFAHKYAECGDATLAYRFSYNYIKMKDSTIWTEAWKLLNHPEVSKRIDEIQSYNAAKNAITVDSLNKKLEVAYAGALGKDQNGAAVQAVMGLAKLNGLLVDKVDSKVQVTVETSYA